VNARYDHVTESDLGVEAPSAIAPARPAPPDATTLESVEMEHIQHVLESVGGNRSRAAKLLGLDRKTLSRRLKRASDAAAKHGNGAEVSGPGRGTRG